MKQAHIKRGKENNGIQTIGEMTFSGDNKIISLFTLELAWKDNARGISCIPIGVYEVKLTFSNKYQKWMWQIMEVPDRSGVRVHSGNFYFDIEGCILLGLGLKDINKDGYQDVIGSRDAIKLAKKHLGDNFILTIE